MTQKKKSFSRPLLAALGLSCICATISPAQSASPGGLEGGLTAYQFDGVYKGNSQRITTHDDVCGPGQQVALEVHNGRVRMPWNESQVFDARVSRDGTFFATTGGSLVQAEKHLTIIPTLQGRIGPAGLVADYGTRWCRYRLEASQSTAMQHLSEFGAGARP
jgi:hypothetical protein